MNNAKNNKKICEKCGRGMKKSGPYARLKKEGQPSHKKPSHGYYSCMNDLCSEFGKSTEVLE